MLLAQDTTGAAAASVSGSHAAGGVPVQPRSGTAGSALPEDPEHAQARLRRIHLKVLDGRGREHNIRREDLARAVARGAFRALARGKLAATGASGSEGSSGK